jgi:hypothetical protein
VEGEAAVQFGRRGGASLAAWGLDIESRWEANRVLPFLRQVAGGLVFLSGDDPGSGGWEGWVPPFSRWPAWSESYIFTLAADNDGRLAEWTNFVSLYGRLELELTERLDLSLGVQRLLAPQASSGTWDMAQGGGRVRGNLWVFRLGFMFSDHLAGHLLYEGFSPGDYYLGEADGYSFLRLELQLLI